MLNSLSTLNSPENAAIREKITMIAREIIATIIANLNAVCEPEAFSAMKTTYRMIHHTHIGSETPRRVDAIPSA